MGVGCGRSRGLRLLNLYDPYAASLVGRAAEAGEDVGAAGRLTGSCDPTRVGSFDRERMTEGITSPPGDRSNLSASTLTLFDTCGGEREATEDAGPDTERGPVLGGDRTVFKFTVFCR